MLQSNWPSDVATRWPNFTASEMECKCGCGQVPEIRFMNGLQFIRYELDSPLMVTSGFRCLAYDARIGGANVHPTGFAADISIGYRAAYLLISEATPVMTGIGIAGRGDNRFVHLDMLPLGETHDHPRPRIWTYDE